MGAPAFSTYPLDCMIEYFTLMGQHGEHFEIVQFNELASLHVHALQSVKVHFTSSSQWITHQKKLITWRLKEIKRQQVVFASSVASRETFKTKRKNDVRTKLLHHDDRTAYQPANADKMYQHTVVASKTDLAPNRHNLSHKACCDDQPSSYSGHPRTSPQTDAHSAIAPSVHKHLTRSSSARQRSDSTFQEALRIQRKPQHPHCAPSSDTLSHQTAFRLSWSPRSDYDTCQ